MLIITGRLSNISLFYLAYILGVTNLAVPDARQSEAGRRPVAPPEHGNLNPDAPFPAPPSPATLSGRHPAPGGPMPATDAPTNTRIPA